MIQFYHIGIILMAFLIRIASLFNDKARKFIQGRKKTWESIEQINPGEKIIWFHCSSLGEFEQGRPVIEKLKETHPEYKILLTFFSPSGYEIRKNYEHAEYITYLPIDTPRNARKFIQKVQPQMVFFVKYEFWYFMLRELHRHRIKTYLISAIFRNNQFFFKWYGKKFRKMISWFDHLFVQDEFSYKLLQNRAYKNVSISGDTRLDRVLEITQKASTLPLIETFKQNNFLLIAGSSWKKDEELLFRYFKEKNKPFKMLIAPHEVHESNIQRIIEDLKPYKSTRYSEASENNIEQADVLIIDSIGLLSSLYRYGSIAYIGGGFGKGIHNLLEPATWGLPVIFGPNHQKFKEAKELINIGGGFSIDNYQMLEQTIDHLLHIKKNLKDAGNAARNYIENNSGATDLIINHI